MSEKDNATAAELTCICPMKVASSHFSYASCDDIKETFEAVSRCSSQKLFSEFFQGTSILHVSDAIGPYFHKMLIDDIKFSNCFCFVMRPQMPSTSSSLIFK